MRVLLEDTSQRALRYLDGLNVLSVGLVQGSVSGLDRLRVDLPEDSTDPKDVIAEVDNVVSAIH